jgi:lipopolysaccharide/colanic/teichoic acid biosynthesis glycosyltransferase
MAPRTIAHSRPWYDTASRQRLLRGRAYAWAKRALDIAVCLLGAPIVLPLIGLLGLLVVLDSPGPLFFHQWRVGKGGRRFRIHKLRTMTYDAEARKLDYAHLNEQVWPDFKIRADPRITRVGRILRRTSLDELPQLYNVLVGEMSLVGPRPNSFAPETYQLWQTARLDVVPGITGLAQVSGRSWLSFEQRVKLDLAYIDCASLWVDICILLRTVVQVFVADGAY